MDGKWMTILVLIFMSSFLFAQYTAMSGDGVENIQALIDEHDKPYFGIIIEKGNTLYSISRKYHISMDVLREYNNLQETTNISIGQEIRIPLAELMTYEDPGSHGISASSTFPVYYTVLPGNTFFRISRIFFPQSQEVMIERNSLTSHDLQPGQQLLVGWILTGEKAIATVLVMHSEDSRRVQNPEPIPQIAITESSKDTMSIYIRNEIYVPVEEKPVEKLKLTQRREVAIWDKQSGDQQNMFALHKEASPNSVIEIYNPLLRRTTYATVIGKIPANTYPEDVSLIISPKVAKSLGALDSRFMVEVKYYEKY